MTAGEDGSRFLGGVPLSGLVGLFALLCLVLLALLTFFTIHLADHAVVREVNARARSTTAVSALLVQEQMHAVGELTASYASRPFLIKALGDGNPASFDAKVINQQLSSLEAAQLGSAGAFLTDTRCRLTQVVPATPRIVGTDFSFRDWCKGVRRTRGPYVSDAYQTAAAGHPLVVAAAAIVRTTTGDQVGRPLGILGLLYTLSAVKSFAGQLAQAQGVHLTITDRHGTVLAGDEANAGPGANALVSAVTDPRVREALSGRSGVTRSTTANGEALSAFAPVASLGWTVTGEVPTRDALAGVRGLRSTVLGVAGLLGLVLLCGIGLLWWTLRLRREAERRLNDGDKHTRAILEAAADGFVSMDTAGRISAWNGQAHDIFGWTEAEALGRQLAQTIIPPDQQTNQERGVAQLLATGGGPLLNERIEVTALHRDGHEFPAELATWAVRSMDGWSLNAFVRDITERKQRETELAVAHDQALEASRLKSEFLANMSHEIRTPMNGVLGMTSLLLETDLNVEQREFAETALLSGEALLSILNDILDFSKVEAGHLHLESVEFDLRALVEEVARLLGVSASSKALKLIRRVPADSGMVRGDPGRVRQVLINLIGNAIKFTECGQVVVRVNQPEVIAGERFIRLEVSDTGDGIEAANLDLIFEPFVQADASTCRKYGGTGLGLAISGHLVALMGGDCGVTSTLGVGSTFWFTLPVHTDAGQAAHHVAAQTSVAVAPGLQTVGGASVDAFALSLPSAGEPEVPRLLLAEDNLVNQKVTVAMLSSAGYHVDTVPNGAAAVQAASIHTYDAILMDCQMPELNGYDATAAIRANEGAARHTPIIAMTAGARQEDRERCLAEGMDGYLAKPVRKDALLDALRQSLDGNPE